MNVQVLVVTMNESDMSLVKRMNIHSDALIANQSNKFAYEEIAFDFGKIALVTTNTKGASRNRNIALTLSSKEIVLFCDDDVRLIDDYKNMIVEEFEKHPDVDVIKFFCESDNSERPLAYKRPNVFKKAKRSNIMSAGVVLLAAKRDRLLLKNIRFNEMLGPGTRYPNGEDSVFLNDILKSGLRIYLSPLKLGTVRQDGSSWFSGYNESFFYTVGIVYREIYGLLSFFVAARRAIRMNHSKRCSMGFVRVFSAICRGIKAGN